MPFQTCWFADNHNYRRAPSSDIESHCAAGFEATAPRAAVWDCASLSVRHRATAIVIKRHGVSDDARRTVQVPLGEQGA